MKSFNTKYGDLIDVGEYELYDNGNMKECILGERSELITEYGILVPQYEFTDHRKKYIYSVSFYNNGTLRRIAPNEKTRIMTPIGSMTAELITFYESGKLKRLFPLNGRISAYWDESDEYRLTEEKTFEFSFGNIRTRIISISFYENGAIKDLTFWPKEIIKINAPVGEVKVRTGIAVHPDGTLKSMEPSSPILVPTPIGNIKAFDYNANGINGDRNSLMFSEKGEITSLITSDMKIIITNRETQQKNVYSPSQDLDPDGQELCFHTLKLDFSGNEVCINDEISYKLTDYQFTTEPYTRKAPSQCTDCASCGRCG